jgi:putative transposase
MSKRYIYDHSGHAHYVTFSCYRRRRLLDDDNAKRIVIGMLNTQLKIRNGKCTGFVVMPDHVHAVVWFPKNGQLSDLMKQWKQRSSVQIKKNLKENLIQYKNHFDIRDPVWQPKYYDFNLYSPDKIMEKVNYMHANPVRAGLVKRPEDWIYSSARFYIEGKCVGLPIAYPG